MRVFKILPAVPIIPATTGQGSTPTGTVVPRLDSYHPQTGMHGGLVLSVQPRRQTLSATRYAGHAVMGAGGKKAGQVSRKTSPANEQAAIQKAIREDQATLEWHVGVIADQCDLPHGLLKSHLYRQEREMGDILRRIAKRPDQKVDDDWFIVEPTQVKALLADALKTLTCLLNRLEGREQEKLAQMVGDALRSDDLFFELIGLLTEFYQGQLGLEHLSQIIAARHMMLEVFGNQVEGVNLIPILSRIHRFDTANAFGARAELQFVIDMARQGKTVKSIPTKRFIAKRCDFIVDGTLHEVKLLYLGKRRFFPEFLNTTIPNTLSLAREQLLSTARAMRTSEDRRLTLSLYLSEEYGDLVEKIGTATQNIINGWPDGDRFAFSIGMVDVESLITIPVNRAVAELVERLREKVGEALMLSDFLPPRTKAKDARIIKCYEELGSRLMALREFTPEILSGIATLIEYILEQLRQGIYLPEDRTQALAMAQSLLYHIELLEYLEPFVVSVRGLSEGDLKTIQQQMQTQGAFSADQMKALRRDTVDPSALPGVLSWFKDNTDTMIASVRQAVSQNETLRQRAMKFRLILEPGDGQELEFAVEQYARTRALAKDEGWGGHLQEIKGHVEYFLRLIPDRDTTRSQLQDLQKSLEYGIIKPLIEGEDLIRAKEIIALIVKAYPEPVAEVPASQEVSVSQAQPIPSRQPSAEEVALQAQIQRLKAERLIALRTKPKMRDIETKQLLPDYWTKPLDREIKALYERLRAVVLQEEEKALCRARRAASLPGEIGDQEALLKTLMAEEVVIKDRIAKSRWTSVLSLVRIQRKPKDLQEVQRKIGEGEKKISELREEQRKVGA